MPLNGTRPSAVAASTLCRHFYALRESFTSYESSPDQCDPLKPSVAPRPAIITHSGSLQIHVLPVIAMADFQPSDLQG